MQKFEWWELKFVDHLVIAEHLLRAFARPIEILDGPMYEGALEGLDLGQPD
jgi:hypothetical protein